MQKEYSDIQNSIINANINICCKFSEIIELNNIINSLGNNISNLGNNLEIKKFTKIKNYYTKKILILKKEILLLNHYINRKEEYSIMGNNKKIKKFTK